MPTASRSEGIAKSSAWRIALCAANVLLKLPNQVSDPPSANLPTSDSVFAHAYRHISEYALGDTAGGVGAVCIAAAAKGKSCHSQCLQYHCGLPITFDTSKLIAVESSPFNLRKVAVGAALAVSGRTTARGSIGQRQRWRWVSHRCGEAQGGWRCGRMATPHYLFVPLTLLGCFSCVSVPRGGPRGGDLQCGTKCFFPQLFRVHHRLGCGHTDGHTDDSLLCGPARICTMQEMVREALP